MEAKDIACPTYKYSGLGRGWLGNNLPDWNHHLHSSKGLETTGITGLTIADEYKFHPF